MTRLYRLLSPGIVFAALGLVVLANSKWSWFQFRGGLAIIGLYALALQIVLSALLISAIDDLSGSSPWHFAGRRVGKLIRISTQPVSFRRSLAEFYRRPFWPVFLLGFGLAASLSAVAAGVFHETTLTADYVSAAFGMHRSETLLGALLVLGAAFLWWRGGAPSYFGWVIGVCLATVAGQVVFVYWTNTSRTVMSWGGVMIGLCLLRLLVLGIGLVWGTRARAAPGAAT